MGKNVVDPVEINTVFTKYYKDLYKSEYSDSANKKKRPGFTITSSDFNQTSEMFT